MEVHSAGVGVLSWTHFLIFTPHARILPFLLKFPLSFSSQAVAFPRFLHTWTYKVRCKLHDTLPPTYFRIWGELKLRIPRMVEERKEVKMAFIKLSGGLKIFPPPWFLWRLKKIWGISAGRFNTLPLSQHMRHISHICIICLCDFKLYYKVTCALYISQNPEEIKCNTLIG